MDKIIASLGVAILVFFAVGGSYVKFENHRVPKPMTKLTLEESVHVVEQRKQIIKDYQDKLKE